MVEGHRGVVWTVSARDSLDEIIEYVSIDSPVGAEKVLDLVLAAVESLSQLSERGRLVPEIASPDFREIFVYRYRVIYQISASEVRILAVIHDAMDFMARFDQE